MFTSKKKLQLIDYQDSYYYRKQRNKRRNKWLKISFILLLVIVLVFIFAPFAQSTPLYLEQKVTNENSLIQGPQLVFDHPNPAMRATFPLDIEANIEINGLVAHAEIKQTFINPHGITLEGRYQFPLPENSAVKKLIIKVADKEIVGKIMENKSAKALYQKAKNQGKKASLVEQRRPNLFTNKIANIPAQSIVVVTLTFIMPVSFVDGHFNLTLPLAMTKKYQPMSFKKSSINSSVFHRGTSHSHSKKLDEVSKRSNKISTYTQGKPVARSQSSINIALNSGVPITAIFSNSHKIKSRAINSTQNNYLISLNKTHEESNKSFNLSWQLLENNQPQISIFTEEISGEHYSLLTFFPPKTEIQKVIERDLIFIIDTSGSMQGSSIEQAKSSLQLALLQLNDKDSFNIIAFDDEATLLFPMTEMASKKNISKALTFIDNLIADGGTEMYRPLSNALMMKKSKKQSVKAIRQIVFITDGAVTNELELMQLLNTAQGSFRLYTVGIGAAPNGYFMKKAAQFGRGSYVFIQKQNEVQQKMTDFMTKISQPAVSNIKLIFDNHVQQHVDVYPKMIPDLYFNDPLQLAIKSQLPITSVQLTGETATTPWYRQLIINENTSSKGISSLWARRKIESLLDSLVVGANKGQVKSQVISTSLNHQIISPYTSFIAIEKQSEVLPLFAKNNLSDARQPNSNTIQAHESLMVAMPQTSIGWLLQFLIGIALLLMTQISQFSHLSNRYLKK